MAIKKKLQVFVSSTFTDMIDERQAAVEAILQAGHIPAGMELFAAGNKSQLEVIYQWIDESDVYLLLLGGRYGSLDPYSQVSYTELEYAYAVEKNKPHFVCVLTDEYLNSRIEKPGGTLFLESDNPQQIKDLRKKIMSSKIVKPCSGRKDIQLAIFQTLNIYANNEELIGWIPGDQGASSNVLEQLAILTKENQRLQKEVINHQPRKSDSRFLMEWQDLKLALFDEVLNLKQLPELPTEVENLRYKLGHKTTSLMHYFIYFADLQRSGQEPVIVQSLIDKLIFYELIKINFVGEDVEYSVTSAGKAFFLLVETQSKKRPLM